MKQLFTHQRLHHQGANNLLHNVFTPLRRFALLVLMLCTAWGAWGQNITIKINNTTTKTGNSLENALSGVNLSSVTKLEITAGTFTTADWRWLEGPKLSNLKNFIVQTTVSSVDDVPSPNNGNISTIFPKKMTTVRIAKVTSISRHAFFTIPIENIELPDVTTIGNFAFSQTDEPRYTTNLLLPKIETIGQTAFGGALSTTCTLKINSTPPTVQNEYAFQIEAGQGTPVRNNIIFVDKDGNNLTGNSLEIAMEDYSIAGGHDENSPILDWYNWRWLPTYKVKYSAGENGRISGSGSLGYLEYEVSKGRRRSATAQENDGFEFYEWSDHVTDNPRVDNNIQSNIDVTAYFRVKTTKTKLIYSANSGGLVKKGVSGALASSITEEGTPGEDGPEIYPVANTGHLFLNWNDGKIDEPRSDKYDNTDITYSANFVTTGTEIVTLNYASDNNGYINGIRGCLNLV